MEGELMKNLHSMYRDCILRGEREEEKKWRKKGLIGHFCAPSEAENAQSVLAGSSPFSQHPNSSNRGRPILGGHSLGFLAEFLVYGISVLFHPTGGPHLVNIS